MSPGSRSPSAGRRAVVGWVPGLVVAGVLATTTAGHAASIVWKGHTWEVTSGGMAGVCQGSPANVTVDSQDYLHLRISKNGNTWSAAELFTTDRLGFGTYQWQTDGPIDSYDKNVVLGLFPYGPSANIGSDGTNEIDIEYSRWGVENGDNGDFTNYPASGSTIGEHSFTFALAGGSLATSRFAWSSASITSSLLEGLVAVDETSGLVETWTYAPPNPSMNVPQQALPLGMNLWCFDAPPSNDEPVEIVIRDFVFVPEDAASGGQAGEGGAPPSGGKAGATGDGGRTAGSGAGGNGGSGGQNGGSGGATAGRAASAGGSGGAVNTAGAASGRAGGEPGGAGRGGAPTGAGGSSSMPGGGAGASTTQHPTSDRSSGCGCRAAGTPGSNAALPLVGALLGLSLRRRRRLFTE